jgi:Domain of unknown function (DUF4177)
MGFNSSIYLQNERKNIMYEYKITTEKIDYIGDYDINYLAEQGWRLVNVIPYREKSEMYSYVKLIFERKKAE